MENLKNKLVLNLRYRINGEIDGVTNSIIDRRIHAYMDNTIFFSTNWSINIQVRFRIRWILDEES